MMDVSAVTGLATTVINKIWPDKSEAEKQQLAAAVMVVQGQLDINKVEAASPSVFEKTLTGLVWLFILGLGSMFLGWASQHGYKP